MLKRRQVVPLLVSVVLSVLVGIGAVFAASQKPVTAAEIALYSGLDRQQLLEEGAKKEGKLTLYTTSQMTTVRPRVDAFQKKYPFIKVEVWNPKTAALIPRMFEEYTAGKHVADIIEVSQSGEVTLEERGLLQPFYSPALAFIKEGALRKALGGGVFAAGHWESGYSLGYNTKLMHREDLPRTYQDLLDARWQGSGKVAIGSDSSSHYWIGAMLATYGEDFVRRMARQNFVVHAVTSRAILDMIINGEYAFSPNVSDVHVADSKKKGAPLDWAPIEPVPIFLGQVLLPKYPASPHAALLFLDFDLSREVGELFKAAGYVSPRKDVPGGTTYKKYYGPFSTKQFEQWNALFDQLFMKR